MLDDARTLIDEEAFAAIGTEQLEPRVPEILVMDVEPAAALGTARVEMLDHAAASSGSDVSAGGAFFVARPLSLFLRTF
jgi:hypothetical protein